MDCSGEKAGRKDQSFDVYIVVSSRKVDDDVTYLKMAFCNKRYSFHT